MSSIAYNKRKGRDFENDNSEFLRPIFPDVQRTGSARVGNGDLENTGDYCIEVKNRRELRLSAWITQVEQAAARIGARFPVVIAKRKMHGVDKAYVVMSNETFRRLVARAEGVEQLLEVEECADEPA